MTALKKPDALARLLAHCDYLSDGHERRKTRRLIRALRDADYAAGVRAGVEHVVDERCDCPGRGRWLDAIPAIVLRRPRGGR